MPGKAWCRTRAVAIEAVIILTRLPAFVSPAKTRVPGDFPRLQLFPRAPRSALCSQISHPLFAILVLSQKSFAHEHTAIMSAIGSLVFCTDCGNLLDATSGKQNAILVCQICGASCKGTLADPKYLRQWITRTSRYVFESSRHSFQARCFSICVTRKTVRSADCHRSRHTNPCHYQPDLREMRQRRGPILYSTIAQRR